MPAAGRAAVVAVLGTAQTLAWASTYYLPAILAALAPWLFGIRLDRWGAGALWLSVLLGFAAFAALALLHASRRQSPPAVPRPTES